MIAGLTILGTPPSSPIFSNPVPDTLIALLLIEEITPELIINKIKEKGVYADGAYVTVKEADNKKIEIYYFVDLNQLMILSNEDFIYDYLFTENKYHCYQTGITDCKESINNFLKENLI